jgi:Flp pilus assembly protein TadD
MHLNRNHQSIARMLSRYIAVLSILTCFAGCRSLRRDGCDEILNADGIATAIEAASPLSQKAHHQGIKLFDRGKVAEAGESFEKAIELDYNNGPAHNNLGLVYFQQHRLTEAAECFGIASRLRPQDASPLNNLGMTLEAAGRTEESLEYFQRARELSPNSPLYLGNLIRARMRLGESDASIYQQLKELQSIETRPDWLEWIEDQLAIDQNPMRDRSTPTNLNRNKTKTNQDNDTDRNEALEPIHLGQDTPILLPSLEHTGDLPPVDFGQEYEVIRPLPIDPLRSIDN